MSALDYRMIIQEYSEPAFRQCVGMLYPVLNFRALQQEEIRRVDLLERILQLMPATEKETASGSFEEYIKTIRFYLDNFLAVGKNTIAERYKNRGLEILQKLNVAGNILEVAEDLCMVVMALFRGSDENYVKKIPIKKVELSALPEDEDLLRRLREYDFKNPNLANNSNPFAKAVNNALPFAKAVMGDWTQHQSEKDRFYIENTLLYCRMMDANGGYEQEVKSSAQ